MTSTENNSMIGEFNNILVEILDAHCSWLEDEGESNPSSISFLGSNYIRALTKKLVKAIEDGKEEESICMENSVGPSDIDTDTSLHQPMIRQPQTNNEELDDEVDNKYELVIPKTLWKGRAYQLRKNGAHPIQGVETWIPKYDWKKMLSKWKPTGVRYLGGVKSIDIKDRKTEIKWLERCLTKDESLDNMSIVYLGRETCEDGSEHLGWHKTMIKNNATQEVSGRSVTNCEEDIKNAGGLYTKTGKESKTRKKAVEKGWYTWVGKVAADESFFKNLKEKLL